MLMTCHVISALFNYITITYLKVLLYNLVSRRSITYKNYLVHTNIHISYINALLLVLVLVLVV